MKNNKNLNNTMRFNFIDYFGFNENNMNYEKYKYKK